MDCSKIYGLPTQSILTNTSDSSVSLSSSNSLPDPSNTNLVSQFVANSDQEHINIYNLSQVKPLLGDLHQFFKPSLTEPQTKSNNEFPEIQNTEINYNDLFNTDAIQYNNDHHDTKLEIHDEVISEQTDPLPFASICIKEAMQQPESISFPNQVLSLTTNSVYNNSGIYIKEKCFYCTELGYIPGFLTITSEFVTFEPIHNTTGKFQVFIDTKDLLECAYIHAPLGRDELDELECDDDCEYGYIQILLRTSDGSVKDFINKPTTFWSMKPGTYENKNGSENVSRSFSANGVNEHDRAIHRSENSDNLDNLSDINILDDESTETPVKISSCSIENENIIQKVDSSMNKTHVQSNENFKKNSEENESFESSKSSRIIEESNSHDKIKDEGYSCSTSICSGDILTNSVNKSLPFKSRSAYIYDIIPNSKSFVLFKLQNKDKARNTTVNLIELIDKNSTNLIASSGPTLTTVPFCYASPLDLWKFPNAHCQFDNNFDDSQVTNEYSDEQVRKFYPLYVRMRVNGVTENIHDLAPPDYFLPKGAAAIIDSNIALQISYHLPSPLYPRKWVLAFCSLLNGISFRTFYRLASNRGPSILIIKDTNEVVFGGFASEGFHLNHQYYGNGESFVFTFYHGNNRSNIKEYSSSITVYKATMKNLFFTFSDETVIAMGGGDSYALTVDNEFFRGSSSHCDTFDNKCLTSSDDFILKNFQIWIFEDA